MAFEHCSASPDSNLQIADAQASVPALAAQNYWTREGFAGVPGRAQATPADATTIASGSDGFAIVNKTGESSPHSVVGTPPQAAAEKPPQAAGETIPHAATEKPPQAAAEKPPQAAGETIPHAATEKPPQSSDTPHLAVSENGIISIDYHRQVDTFLASLPPPLVKWAGDHGIKVAIYNNSEQMPATIREAQAQGHTGETVGNIPMFYDPASRTLVFVEHPTLTAGEQTSKDKFDHSKAYNESKHVMTFGQLSSFDPKAQHYAPLARNGNHEFGHALDQADSTPITSTADFDRDFKMGLSRLSNDEKKLLHYFVEADPKASKGHEFDRAKRELFAELFSIEHVQKGFGQRYDQLMLGKFHELVELMRKDPRGLIPQQAKSGN
ncbi:MAG TPA: hypothetical protein V6C72_01415 [Chroococcales cyanobacterium]